MRTILLFPLAAIFLAAQTPRERYEALEKQIEANPDQPGNRNSALEMLARQRLDLPEEKIREARRRHILWLIEFYPEMRFFIPATALIPPRGRFADPEGYAETTALWKRQIAKPGASTEIIANAAIYMKAFDRPEAREILNTGLRDHPNDAALNRALGIVDAADLAGISTISDRGFFTVAPAQNDAARRALDTSKNADRLTGAATFFAQNNIDLPFDARFGDDDQWSLAERWLRRAVEIDPRVEQGKQTLANVLRVQSSRSTDPRDKVRLLRDAEALSDERAKSTFLPDLAKAEFDSNDDAAAERDARRMLEIAPDVARRNPQTAAMLTHRGNTILGQLALMRGDKAEAKQRLAASLKLPEKTNNFQFPGVDLGLAQDLADAGERDAVLAYLEQSRVFWKYDRGRIDHLVNLVRKTKSPDLMAVNFNPPGPPAPFSLRDREGKEWSLESLSGKTVALEFFRSDCARCVQETFPQLEKAAKDFSGVVLAVEVGGQGGEGSLKLPVLLDSDGAVAKKYDIEASPTLVVIPREGPVRTFPGFTPDGGIADFLSSQFAGPQRIPDAPEPLSTSNPRKLAWTGVANAASYVVEWDVRDDKGWVMDREHSFGVIPTAETSVIFDQPGAGTYRWRVYAVPRFGAHGPPSPWREITIPCIGCGVKR
jgi:peroxiredoxin